MDWNLVLLYPIFNFSSTTRKSPAVHQQCHANVGACSPTLFQWYKNRNCHRQPCAKFWISTEENFQFWGNRDGILFARQFRSSNFSSTAICASLLLVPEVLTHWSTSSLSWSSSPGSATSLISRLADDSFNLVHNQDFGENQMLLKL